MGAPRSIGEIRWLFSRSGSADYVRVQISNDRSVWTTLTRIQNPTANTWQSFTTNASARYVRFLFSNPNGDAVLGYLAEVEFRPAVGVAATGVIEPAMAPTEMATSEPTRTPRATEIVIPATAVPAPPTNTPVPSTETPVPPTETPIPPTETPIPPTETPVSPTEAPTDVPLDP